MHTVYTFVFPMHTYIQPEVCCPVHPVENIFPEGVSLRHVDPRPSPPRAAGAKRAHGIRRNFVSSSQRPSVAVFVAEKQKETDEEAAEEALRRQVFSNEKGFLESSAFNPARARAEREEEEARALAVQWGSTPERAKEVIKRTKEDRDLSFQVGVGIIGARRLVVNGPMSEAGDVCRGGSIALGFMKSARPGHSPTLGGGWVGLPIYSQCWTQWFPKRCT